MQNKNSKALVHTLTSSCLVVEDEYLGLYDYAPFALTFHFVLDSCCHDLSKDDNGRLEIYNVEEKIICSMEYHLSERTLCVCESSVWLVELAPNSSYLYSFLQQVAAVQLNGPKEI
jgi:hypothetical protein